MRADGLLGVWCVCYLQDALGMTPLALAVALGEVSLMREMFRLIESLDQPGGMLDTDLLSFVLVAYWYLMFE